MSTGGMQKFTQWISILMLLGSGLGNVSTGKPNIVFIITDDLGWNDVSFHGSDQIQTPNIDALAFSGVALHRYYTNCMCTPSRSALLTGKYAHRLGMQGYPLTNSEYRGIPKTEKLLPQYLKELGYSTHLVGKWHVGRAEKAFLPTSRGFDTFFGHLGGLVDYYEYTTDENWITGKVSGFDLYRGENVSWEEKGYYTDLLTDEAIKIILADKQEKPFFLELAYSAPHSGSEASLLQAPLEDVRSNRHIELHERRIFAGMMNRLDEGVGKVIEMLNFKGILNNTIIAFVSDNGGMTSGYGLNWASNYPLRGIKMTPWEGGVRVVGALWTPSMANIMHHTWSGFMHVTDWFATILKAAGGCLPSDIDGVDQLENIVQNKESARENIVLEIDDYTGFKSMIKGKYKIVTGTVNVNYSTHEGANLRGLTRDAPSYINALKSSRLYTVFKNMGSGIVTDQVEALRRQLQIDCGDIDYDGCTPSNEKWCLYNIEKDPCEKKDLSEELQDVGREMLEVLEREWNRRIPRTVPLYRDPASAPSLHNYTWAPWVNQTI